MVLYKSNALVHNRLLSISTHFQGISNAKNDLKKLSLFSVDLQSNDECENFDTSLFISKYPQYNLCTVQKSQSFYHSRPIYHFIVIQLDAAGWGRIDLLPWP